VVGILAGTWLAEYGAGTAYGAVIRFLNDVLISAPSILIGLFVYQLLVAPFHGFSAIAGAVALAFLATPIVVRTTEDILSLQPSALREAGMALGASRAFVIRRIIWKSARTGLLTAGLLGFARISGETAPLLFTSLGNLNNNYNHLTQPMASLPTTIFQFALSAYDDWQRLAWVGALLIALAVLAINIIGRLLARETRP
jgi:phosphate transport system permease protein